MREVEYEFFNHDTTRRNKRAGFFGGANLDFIKRIEELENKVDQLSEKRATTESFGLAKTSSATDVTDESSGIVLSAIQNNAGIKGTLANKIGEIDKKFGEQQFLDITNRISVPIKSSDGNFVIRCGNIVFFKISCNVSKQSGTGKSLGEYSRRIQNNAVLKGSDCKILWRGMFIWRSELRYKRNRIH